MGPEAGNVGGKGDERTGTQRHFQRCSLPSTEAVSCLLFHPSVGFVRHLLANGIIAPKQNFQLVHAKLFRQCFRVLGPEPGSVEVKSGGEGGVPALR